MSAEITAVLDDVPPVIVSPTAKVPFVFETTAIPVDTVPPEVNDKE